MAITLVTGVPRSGKTLYAVSLIAQALEEGREVYSDIDGIEAFEGVIKFDGDWRETPHGSLIVFDEVHKRWPAAGQSGMSKDPIINDLDEHGHYGWDLVLITQWPTKTHFEVRTNVSRHVHVVRTMGAQSAVLYEWNQAQGSPDRRDTRDIADTTPFPYPKKLYDKYKSSTLHNVKFKLPAKLKLIFTLILSLLGFLFYLLFGSSSALFASESSENQNSYTIAEVVSVEAKPTPPPEKPNVVLGCISSATSCLCYDTDSQPIDMSFYQCLDTMSEPLRFPMNIEAKT